LFPGADKSPTRSGSPRRQNGDRQQGHLGNTDARCQTAFGYHSPESLRPEFENLTDDVFGGANSTDSQNELRLVDWAVQNLAGWYRAGSVLEKALQELVCVLHSTMSAYSYAILQIKEGWQTSLQVLLSLFKHIPDDIKKSFFSVIFPVLNDVRISTCKFGCTFSEVCLPATR